MNACDHIPCLLFLGDYLSSYLLYEFLLTDKKTQPPLKNALTKD